MNIENINGVEVRKWKYQGQGNFDTGYTKENKEIFSQYRYTSEYYNTLIEEDKEKLIQEVFEIYRAKNIFPIYYYTEAEIIEEIQYMQEYMESGKIEPFDGNILKSRANLGSTMLRYLFPNIQCIDCKGVKNNSMWDRFNDDHKLKRAIKYCFDFKNKVKTPCTSTNVFSALQLIGGSVGNNWLPLRTTLLLNYYSQTRKPGEKFIYLDCAAGFGSRMLGSQVTSEDNPIYYIGIDPNSETIENNKTLKEYIKKALGHEDDRMTLLKQGSEDFFELEEKADIQFTSPCYFNLEAYTKEETQCYNKYPTLEEWKEGFVAPTIQNIYNNLKEGGLSLVNIADFKVNNEDVHFVDDWIEISKKIGFTFEKEVLLKVGKSRPNNKSIAHAYVPKEEGIFVFRK